jgi:hypothetical protein
MVVSVGEIWSDLDGRLNRDALGQIRRAVNVDAVMTSIDNILRTSPGERVMLPQFGCSLRSVLFENMNSAVLTHLSRQIKNAIELWDDRVEIVEVNMYQEPDMNTVSVKVSFIISGQARIYEYVTSVKGELA